MGLSHRYDVWVASLTEWSGQQAALDAVLTAEERAYASQYRREGATVRLSRGLLRLVLARYLRQPPTAVDIDRSCPTCPRPHGKPRLRSRPPASPPLEFSVAHGGDLLVLAVASAGVGPVGVDVEATNTGPGPTPELLEFTLTSAERRRVAQAPTTARRELFLRYWTGKEAVGKALGTGLDAGLLALTLPPLPLSGSTNVPVSGQLWITEVDVGEAYVCTLATARSSPDVHLIRASPARLFTSESG